MATLKERAKEFWLGKSGSTHVTKLIEDFARQELQAAAEIADRNRASTFGRLLADEIRKLAE